MNQTRNGEYTDYVLNDRWPYTGNLSIPEAGH